MTKKAWSDLRSDITAVGEEIRLQLHLARMELVPRLHGLDRRLFLRARRAADRIGRRAVDLADDFIFVGGS
jgi:hypothetical protein